MQYLVGLAPAIESSADGFQHIGQRGEVAVVSSKAPSQLPHSLDRSQLRAVGRQEQQAQLSSMAMKKVDQESCVMITSVVEHDDHAASGRLLAKQPSEESPERGGVEDRAHHPYELPGIRSDGTKAGHRLSSWRVPQDRILDFGRHPHAAAGTVLLEVAFIQTPQFDVGTASQTSEFFLLPRLLADPIGRLGGGAYVTESPGRETVVGIAARRGPLHIAAADAPTTPVRPTAWPPSRSLAGFCASPIATCANPLHPACAVGPIARLRAVRPGRPLRSGSPSVALSCRSRQTVQSVVVARLLATLNLLLDRYSHHLSILDLQLAHRLSPGEKNEAIISLCCIIYVVMFNSRVLGCLWGNLA